MRKTYLVATTLIKHQSIKLQTLGTSQLTQLPIEKKNLSGEKKTKIFQLLG